MTPVSHVSVVAPAGSVTVTRIVLATRPNSPNVSVVESWSPAAADTTTRSRSRRAARALVKPRFVALRPSDLGYSK
jgi:hypothetical protein